MGFLWTLIIGLVVGAIAKLIMPGRDPGGIIVTMLLGVAGAFVGGFLYQLLTGQPQFFEFDLGSFVIAVIGAIILLLLYRLLTGRRA